MPTTIKLPTDLSSFVSGAGADDIQKLQDAVNAFQSLKVTINIGGTSRTVNAAIQISGESAILEINL